MYTVYKDAHGTNRSITGIPTNTHCRLRLLHLTTDLILCAEFARKRGLRFGQRDGLSPWF